MDHRNPSTRPSGLASPLARLVFAVVVPLLAAGSIGCASGDQPVKWHVAYPIDATQGFDVDVRSSVPMPADQLAFMKQNIASEIGKVLRGGPRAPSRYIVRVNITRYDEGSAFARFMLAGLGQMYLDGDVHVVGGNPPTYVRAGQFNKNYSWGGIVGASADMRDVMVAKVGKAVADGLMAPATAAAPPPRPAPAPPPATASTPAPAPAVVAAPPP